jgi:multicomponent Na+:H+ antiporter subunit D
MTAHLPVLAIIVLLGGALVQIWTGRLWPKLAHPFAVATAALAALSMALLAWRVAQEGTVSYALGGWAPPWGIELRVDHLSALMGVMVTGLSLVVLVFAGRGLSAHLNSRRPYFYSLYLLLTLGMSGMTLTGDLFNLYVFLEVTALTSYALIAVGDEQAPVAAFRYLIIGTLGAMFYLLGVAYLYGLTGSLNFVDVAEQLAALPSGGPAAVALALMLVGFGIKAALFPMHAWLPDAYSYAPNVTTAFLGAVGTKIGAYGIFRVLYTVYHVELNPPAWPVLEIMGGLSAVAIVVGSILAIAQTDLKRMLAYSSVAQIGYVLLGFSLTNPLGITGGVLHILNHALMKCCLFLAAAAIVARLGHRDIRHFGGLARDMPITMTAFTVAAISMIGLPPTAGFFSKWYLVLGAVEAGRWPYVGVILGSSLLTAVYFFRILEQAWLRALADPAARLEQATGVALYPDFSRRLPLTMVTPLALAAVAILVLGLGSWSLVETLIRPIVPVALEAG